MKLLVLIAIAGFAFWAGRSYLLGKLRRLRGEPEPERKAPQSVKLLAAAIVIVYAGWIVVRLVNG